MPAEVERKDESRGAVSTTAHLVAYCRGLEMHHSEPMYEDPYALRLGGDIGEQAVRRAKEDQSTEFSKLAEEIALRTKKIDDELLSFVDLHVSSGAAAIQVYTIFMYICK